MPASTGNPATLFKKDLLRPSNTVRNTSVRNRKPLAPHLLSFRPTSSQAKKSRDKYAKIPSTNLVGFLFFFRHFLVINLHNPIGNFLLQRVIRIFHTVFHVHVLLFFNTFPRFPPVIPQIRSCFSTAIKPFLHQHN